MEQKCTLTDQELIEACDSLVGNLAAGTEKWRMSVPVNFNRDSDMLLSEVISRFKERIAPPSPAKAEQEGPWKVKVHHSISDTEAGREYDEYVTITDGRVEFYFDGGIDDNDEQLLCNLLNERNIKLDYDHEAELYASQLEELYKEACAEVDRLRKREQEGLRWVKGDYERLYNQIKGGKRTVCYIDHPRFFQQRDICTIKPNSPDMEFTSRGQGYGGINDPGYCGSEIERFIQLCRGLNAEWLDESGLASSTKEGEIAFAEWTAKGLWSTHGGMWYEYQNEDNPITGEQLYDLYLQSTNNT